MERAMAVVIETERLRLRPFREEDLDAYAALCADPEVMRFLGGPLTREGAWRQMAFFLGHWQLRGFGILAAEERAGGALAWPSGWAKRRRAGRWCRGTR